MSIRVCSTAALGFELHTAAVVVVAGAAVWQWLHVPSPAKRTAASDCMLTSILHVRCQAKVTCKACTHGC
jgi:hypothetical protein